MGGWGWGCYECMPQATNKVSIEIISIKNYIYLN